MKIRFNGQYRNAKGTVVFRYTVSGTEKQIEAYKAAQGDNYREITEGPGMGTPLYFTTRFVGDNGELIITRAGKVVADMSAYEKAASLSNQFTGFFGKEIARQSVAKLLGTTPSDEIEVEEKEASPAELGK